MRPATSRPLIRQTVMPSLLSRRALTHGALLGAATALVPASAIADDLEAEGYALDDISRRVNPRGPVKCPDVELETYRGEHVRYAAAAKIFVGFHERLERMEEVVVALANETYGRAPRSLVHLGTFSCRRIRTYPAWISEHGLGNAIDVAGFDFPALAEKELPVGVHRVFRHPFAVRVHRHWKPARGPAELHATFLRALAERLIARRDIFRVLLGPSFPGHHNHFHFDCAPFRMVDIFDDD